ncbi:MAG: hypothetical protein IMF14_08765 [Proteobacteria bacterium]|nr:hypothetical protein [Pseudomonadota bacterium]
MAVLRQLVALTPAALEQLVPLEVLVVTVQVLQVVMVLALALALPDQDLHRFFDEVPVRSCCLYAS